MDRTLSPPAQRRADAGKGSGGLYLTESVCKIVLQKLIPAPIRILYINNNKGPLDGFVRESTFAKQLYKHFLRDNDVHVALCNVFRITKSTLLKRRAVHHSRVSDRSLGATPEHHLERKISLVVTWCGLRAGGFNVP